MSKTKKIIVMSSLVLLLAVTAVLNVVLARSRSANGDSAVVSANYFTTYRSERTTTKNSSSLTALSRSTIRTAKNTPKL